MRPVIRLTERTSRFHRRPSTHFSGPDHAPAPRSPAHSSHPPLTPSPGPKIPARPHPVRALVADLTTPLTAPAVALDTLSGVR